MLKKVFMFLFAALLAAVGIVSACAAEEPKVTNDAVAYVSYTTGNNEFSGKSADEAKKQLLTPADNAALGILKDGGTLVVSGKLWIGSDYTLEALGSALLITSNDGTTNYANPLPTTNPECAMKAARNATLTLTSDTIIDDILLFEEHNVSNVIQITNNSTLMIGSKIQCIYNSNLAEPVYYTLEVEEGSTLILNGGIFQDVIGNGTVINNGATILSETQPSDTGAVTDTPVTSADTAQAIVTSDEKPAVITTEGTAADTSTADSTEADAPDTSDTAEPVRDIEPENTTDASTERMPSTDASVPNTTPSADEPNVEESTSNTGLIIGIVAAVLIVGIAVAVVVVKKKK